MLNVECFFMVCSARALSNGCKSRVSPNSGNYIAKGKVKAQKLQKQHALKGQKLCILPGILKLLPLQGDKFASVITQGDALG